MRLVVHRHQGLDPQVRVTLRGGQRCVPEELLDRTQIGARSQHVRRKGVPQPVGGDLRPKAAPLKVCQEDPGNTPRA